MFRHKVAHVGDWHTEITVPLRLRIDVSRVDHLVVHRLHDQQRHGRRMRTELQVVHHLHGARIRQHVGERDVEVVVEIVVAEAPYRRERRKSGGLVEAAAPEFRCVLGDHAFERGIDPTQAGHHEDRKPCVQAAVEP